MTVGSAVGTGTSANGTSANGPAGTGAGRHTGKKSRRAARRPARLSLSNWPVSARLVAVFVVASVTGLVFGGLRVTDAMSASDAYGRTTQVAFLGEQATVLAQSLEDERDRYADVAAYGVLAADAAADKATPAVAKPINAALASEQADLSAAEHTTDAQAQRTRALAAGINSAFPSSVQTKAGSVITMIDSISGLRSELVGQPAAQVIANYSNSIADLFVLNDEITSGSGDAALADEVRALGGLSRAKDEASQQRAFIDSTLIEASVNDAGTGKRTAGNPGGAPFNNIGMQSIADAGGLGALTTSQGLEFADLTTFSDAATTAQSNAYLATVAGQQANDAQLIEGFVNLTGDPRLTFEEIGNQTSLGYDRATVAATWFSDMSAVLSQMRSIEAQVMTAIVTRSQSLENGATDSAIFTATVTAAAVLLVLLATALVGRTLVNPLRRLQADALEIATVRLPARVATAAAGTDAAEGPAVIMIEPIGVQSTDEIGRVARAFDQVHAEAVRLAGTEAQLRGSLNAMFISLSRRSVPLIERLSRMIDSMEQNEDDPDQLANLFAMDHMVTRMRRNSENLLVLAGEEPVRKWTESVPLSDVARAAAAEIEQYNRVALAVQPGIIISGQAAADVVHLLAELIENATLFSPQSTQVRVTVMELNSGGVLIEVRDDGVGISASRLADMNWRLDHPPVVDVSISRHMGLYAVSRLAARHGIRVRLRPGVPQGLSALVWLPGDLAKHEPVPAAGSHSRPTDLGLATGARSVTSAKHGTGRHRSGLLAASGDQSALAGRGERAVRPSAVWFAAKRPSGGAAKSPEELAAGWQSPTNGLEPAAGLATAGGLAGTAPRTASDPGGLAALSEESERTASGLPRRVPRTSAHPGSDTPGNEMPAAMVGGGMPFLDAPPGAAASPEGTPYQEAPLQEVLPARAAQHHEQAPARRRSPEAARSRLSGFQLGNRDAAQAGQGAGWGQHAGEENGR